NPAPAKAQAGPPFPHSDHASPATPHASTLAKNVPGNALHATRPEISPNACRVMPPSAAPAATSSRASSAAAGVSPGTGHRFLAQPGGQGTGAERDDDQKRRFNPRCAVEKHDERRERGESSQQPRPDQRPPACGEAGQCADGE